MKPKVQILTRCDPCGGKAYVPDREATSATGERYTRYRPCPHCQGSGRSTRWVDLAQFLALLDACRCQHDHTTAQGGLHFTAGDVWDDLVEVCDDCGARLEP